MNKYYHHINEILLLLLFYSCVCDKNYKESWVELGKKQAIIDTIILQNIVMPINDTISLKIISEPIDGSRYDSVWLNILKDSNLIVVELFSNNYYWVGCGAEPPTNNIIDTNILVHIPDTNSNICIIARQPTQFDTMVVLSKMTN